MAKKSVDVMIEGGKATAAPPLGPALGPLGVNIGQVVAEINKKTAEFKKMQVPVKVTVDEDTKEFEISVGTPPVSALLKKEIGIEKGSGNPKEEKVADVLIEQIIKVAKMKEDALLGNTLKEKVKEIIGTCHSMGVLVEGVPGADAIKLVNEGKFDKEIAEEKTELSEEDKKRLEAEKAKLAEALEKKHAEFEKQAKAIIKEMEGKDKKEIRTALKDAKIPQKIIDELVPAEEVAVKEAKVAASS
ncbi:50S ribosomal protein L11 [Candidatus Woesearchaeota archaeon]|nr:50S ribosomal protein L11 [Candidatus Woesearchaeota archaeon]